MVDHCTMASVHKTPSADDLMSVRVGRRTHDAHTFCSAAATVTKNVRDYLGGWLKNDRTATYALPKRSANELDCCDDIASSQRLCFLVGWRTCRSCWWNRSSRTGRKSHPHGPLALPSQFSVSRGDVDMQIRETRDAGRSRRSVRCRRPSWIRSLTTQKADPSRESSTIRGGMMNRTEPRVALEDGKSSHRSLGTSWMITGVDNLPFSHSVRWAPPDASCDEVCRPCSKQR